jgi:hypothetical protein
MNYVDSQLTEYDGFAVSQSQVDKRRRVRVVHGDRYIEPVRQLASCGEVVGVGVCIDCITDTQSVARGEREVAIDLTELRVNQCGCAALCAADEIRPATTRGYLLEQHGDALGGKGASFYSGPMPKMVVPQEGLAASALNVTGKTRAFPASRQVWLGLGRNVHVVGAVLTNRSGRFMAIDFTQQALFQDFGVISALALTTPKGVALRYRC